MDLSGRSWPLSRGGPDVLTESLGSFGLMEEGASEALHLNGWGRAIRDSCL